MPNQTPLTGSQLPIEIAPGGYTLQAPELFGRVTKMSGTESATRSDSGHYEDRLLEAMQQVEVHTQNVFEIEVTADTLAGSPFSTIRSGDLLVATRENEPAIVLRAPSLGDQVEQVVLYTDEAGVSRWIFPEIANSQTAGATRGGSGEIIFHLPRNGAPTPPVAADEQASRGPISKLGRRLVRVLAWSTDDIVGQGALAVATRWETARRPYALRPLPFTDGEPRVAWDTVRQGRALLLIHGTFSSSRSAFAHLPQTTIDQLCHLYGGRLFAFDHPSLHHSTQQNAQTLLDLLPAGIELNLDILTHSRGGLLGRELTERLPDLNRAGRQLKIHKAILVAAPNRGTILTDGDHGIEMLDRYTNLLTSLPDNAYTLTIEGILLVVKLLLHGALKGLPGLQNMYPKGEYLQRLNASLAHDTQYYALAANFTPSAPGLLARFGKWAADKYIDGVFGEDNDGVVPTRGSYECEPESPGFPVLPERLVVFEKDDQIHHCNYFTSERLNRQIIEWLST